jgi:signal transduction histidine kinase
MASGLPNRAWLRCRATWSRPANANYLVRLWQMALLLSGSFATAGPDALPPVTFSINQKLVQDSTHWLRLVGLRQTRRLTIDLQHPAADTNEYQFRLRGSSDNWTNYRQAAHLTYFQLPGGRYELEVRSRQPGQPVRQLTIELEDQLWQRWWFLPSIYLFVLLVLASGLYLSYLYRLHQQVRMLAVRDRIARDLHDDMGSYLSSISILSQTATTDPARARQTLDRIGQTARQVMASMSDIVWSVNPAQDSMPQILDRMQQVADSLFEQSNTTVSFDIGPGVTEVMLSLERRRDFYLTYKEAMTNACRYASASRVRVSLVREGGWLTLTIQDDGRGFDPRNPTADRPTEGRVSGGGNGLPNMSNRAALLGGVLVIESAPGQGCRVRLQLPA